MVSPIRKSECWPRGGSEVTTDTLLLACSLDVPPGSLVIEMGCGSCGAMLAASEINPGCTWAGFDVRFAPLSEAFSLHSTIPSPQSMLPVQADVSAPPFRPGIADAVMCNPPFAREGECRPSPVRARELSRCSPPLLLHRFIRTGAALLREKGKLLMVNRPAMLGEMLLGFKASGIAAEMVQPVGMPGRPARSVVLTGSKGGGAGLELLPQRTPESILERFGEGRV